MTIDEELEKSMAKIEQAGAVFSSDRKYRYRLWRMWDPSKPVCGFIMLNPSTADEVQLDPTVRRCVNYANRWGYGSLEVGNIFALKSTDPAELYKDTDPIGPENDQAIRDIEEISKLVVVAWGNHGILHNRGKQVLEMLRNPKYLKLTKIGQPQHPLYLSGELKPTPVALVREVD